MKRTCDKHDNDGGFFQSVGTVLTTAAIIVLVCAVIDWLIKYDRPDGRYGVFIIRAIAALLIGLVLYAYARAIIEGTV
jgi:hypothetical protein